MSIYLPILLIVVGIPAILLMIALEDLHWYRQLSRKRMIKRYRKDIAQSRRHFR
jgi:hypothetical protein